jgi:ribosomal subunit interface protein
MHSEPTISFKNIAPSEAVESHVRRRLVDLEKRFARIVDCEVIIEAPQRRKQSGRQFKVHLKVGIPGPDIHVTRVVQQGAAAEDVNLAIHEAFDAAARLLIERKQKRTGHPDRSRTIA